MAWIKRFRISHAIALAVIVLAVAVEWVNPRPVDTLRNRTFDKYQLLAPRQQSQEYVTIVDIDERSLGQIGQWPWPRTVMADLINALTKAGAIVVGLDMAFPEMDRLSPQRYAKMLRTLPENVKSAMRKLPNNETVFAKALKEGRVVLGLFGDRQKVASGVAKAKPRLSVAEVGGDPRPDLFPFPGIIGNVEELTKSAMGQGVVSLVEEGDGVIRRVPLVVRTGKHIFPALTLEMLRIATRQRSIAIKRNEAGISHIALGPAAIPTDANGRVWVRYRLHDRKRYVSAVDVIDGTVPVEKLRNRFILVGTSAAGLFDIRVTPVFVSMPGVEVHANVLETFVSSEFISRPNYANSVEILLLIVASLLVMLLVPKAGPLWTLFILLAAIAGSAAITGYLFLEHKLLVDFTQASAAVFLVFLVMAFDNYMREAADKRRIRQAFTHYLSPAMVEKLVDEPGRLKLGGETKELSVLFYDVRGFTKISEGFKHDPQGLTVLINRLLTPLTEVIMRSEGTIDKYMGDCIMAFWNAPLDTKDHARLTAKAALDMMVAMDTLNEEIRQEAAEDGVEAIPLKIGIGINTDKVVVGNMGSLQRFDYSILGDGVNLASRLEGQSKEYGVDIVVGENTCLAAPDFAFLELDLITVVGKAEAERIYTLLGDADFAKSTNYQAIKENQIALLAAYRSQQWDQIEACCAKGRELQPSLNALFSLYEERVAGFSENPPGEDWDGVYIATRK